MLNYLIMTSGSGSSPDPNIYYRTKVNKPQKQAALRCSLFFMQFARLEPGSTCSHLFGMNFLTTKIFFKNFVEICLTLEF